MASKSPTISHDEEPPDEWRREKQGLYAEGDTNALELLMGLPRVEHTLLRSVEDRHLSGLEKDVRERALLSLTRTHRKYNPRKPFEPWAGPHIRAAADAVKRWRDRPRQIWRGIGPDATTTKLEQHRIELQIDLQPALNQLTDI